MREMKDSGVEWIGETPIDWNIIQIKKLLAARDGGSWGEEPQEDQLDRICYRVADFDFSRLAIVSDAEFTIRNYTQTIIDKLSLERGDILVEKSGGGEKTPVGRAVFYDKDEPGLFANFIERLRIASDTSPRYFFYVWISLYLTGFTNNYIKQTTGIQNLDIKSLVSSVFVPSFDLKLQHRIADYLDAKCAQIDRAIARQQEAIERLKEYKLSVITEAVTKGLNPDVPMKDSGIEWIGEIPEHWEVSRMKNEFILLDYLREPISAENRENKIGLYDYYGASGVIDKIDDYNVEDTVLLIAEDGANLVLRNLPLVYKATGRFWVNNHAHILKPKSTNDYEYMAYLLECADFTRSISGSAQPKLTQSKIASFPIVVPPFDEQALISSRLKQLSMMYESNIAYKKRIIDKLTEYKKSLIYEVVTGKREV